MPGLLPPFDAGFEAVGRVASVGEGVSGLKIGDAVVYSAFGAFSEIKEVESAVERNNFTCAKVRLQVESRGLIPIPSVSGEALTLVVSGFAYP